MQPSALANGKTSIPVNGHLIATAMTARKLSVREVARRSGSTLGIVYRMTKQNTYSADLPLRILTHICAMLDLSLADVFDGAPQANEQPHLITAEEPSHPDAQADTARLAAALILGGSAPPEAIAHAFSWTLDRLGEATTNLNTHLAPIGLRVGEANYTRYITTADATTRKAAIDDVQRVAIAEETTDSMWASTARIIYTYFEGKTHRDLPEGTKPHLAHAVNVGHLTPGTKNESDFVPSPTFLDAFPDL